MRRAAVGFVVAVMLFGVSPRAEAHALLTSSDPTEGVSLRASPPTISLTFTEEPDRVLSSIDVLDASGATHQRGEVGLAAGDRRTLRVSVSDLKDGVYTVSWRVVSTVDGHATAGAFAFGIGVDPSQIEVAAIDATTPRITPLEPAGRFGLYAGLALMIGTAWVAMWLIEPRPRAALQLLLVGAALAVGGVIVFAAAQLRASGASVADLASTSIGRALIGRAVFVALAVAAAIFAARSAPRRGVLLICIAAAVGAMAFHVASGHAATGVWRLAKIAIQLGHFAAVSLWLGGLAALLAVLRLPDDTARTAAVRRYSAVAAVCLAVVAGTGTARAVDEVGTWTDLVSTAYGRIVAAKIALLVVLAILGARQRWWNIPAVPTSLRGLTLIGRSELAVAGVVLVLTATLASLVPARSTAQTQSTAVSLEAVDFARTVRVELEITPAYPGPNTFVVDVQTLRGEEPVRGVRIRLTSDRVAEASVELRRREERWTARTANIAVGGTWQAAVLVDRGAASAEVQFEFHTRCRTTPAAATPGQPTIHTISLGAGREVQGYVDPGRAGANDVHFTFFDADGNELPLDDSATIASIRDGRRVAFEVRRFSSGHFVGGGRLRSGNHVFEIETQTKEDDEPVIACFEEKVS